MKCHMEMVLAPWELVHVMAAVVSMVVEARARRSEVLAERLVVEKAIVKWNE